MKRTIQYQRIICIWIMLLLLFILALVMNICFGSVMISAKDMIPVLMGDQTDMTQYRIIWQIRLPRICAVVILGGALALSGFLLQTFFHNPIAGPYILGISSGAKMLVAITMIYVLDRYVTVNTGILIITAFAGAMISTGFVLLMARKVNRMSMLIVCGVMIGYICSAITDFLITFADDANIVNLHNWSLGSFSGISWNQVGWMSVVVLLTASIVFLMSKPIGAYQMGEVYAQNMGVNIRSFRVILIVCSSLLSACVTAFAGPVSFVGIAVPHLVKTVLKTSKPILVIPTCFVGGAIFCLICDFLARTLFSPTELNISAVTAVFGAPVVIIMMMKKNNGAVHKA